MREGVKVIYIFFNSLRVRVHVFIYCSEKLFLLEDLQGCFTGSHGPEGRRSKGKGRRSKVKGRRSYKPLLTSPYYGAGPRNDERLTRKDPLYLP
jgi:hypothetical protein